MFIGPPLPRLPGIVSTRDPEVRPPVLRCGGERGAGPPQTAGGLASGPPLAPGRDPPRGLPLPPPPLARRFRSATGESISRYLLRLRLGLALDRLAAGDRDLGALADELGFANHSHFTARFRSTFGITPSAFRSS